MLNKSMNCKEFSEGTSHINLGRGSKCSFFKNFITRKCYQGIKFIQLMEFFIINIEV